MLCYVVGVRYAYLVTVNRLHACFTPLATASAATLAINLLLISLLSIDICGFCQRVMHNHPRFTLMHTLYDIWDCLNLASACRLLHLTCSFPLSTHLYVIVAMTDKELKSLQRFVASAADDSKLVNRVIHCAKCHHPRKSIKASIWKNGKRVHACSQKDVCTSLAKCPAATPQKQKSFHPVEWAKVRIRQIKDEREVCSAISVTSVIYNILN